MKTKNAQTWFVAAGIDKTIEFGTIADSMALVAPLGAVPAGN